MKYSLSIIATIMLVLYGAVNVACAGDEAVYSSALPVTDIVMHKGHLFSVGIVHEPSGASRLFEYSLKDTRISGNYALPGIEYSGYRECPYSWDILSDGRLFYATAIDHSPMSSGFYINIMSNKDLRVFSDVKAPLVSSGKYNDCVITSISPLKSIYYEEITGLKGKNHDGYKFYTIMDCNQEYVQFYLHDINNMQLEVYRYQLNNNKTAEISEAVKKDETSKDNNDANKLFGTFDELFGREKRGWTLENELPFVDSEPFVILERESGTRLLNANGSLYQINDESIPYLGKYKGWSRKTGSDAKGTIILFKNKDKDTVSLLEVTDDDITPLVFLPDKPEYTDPFDPPDLTGPQEKALRALLHTMKTTHEEPPVRPTPKSPTAPPAAPNPPTPANP